jgi:tRNA C32,U32 (ribose-2'-O)-methylase TrmJ
MQQLGFLWSLPTSRGFPSLNLAQAVAISLSAVAEVERRRGLSDLGRGLMLSDEGLNPLSGSPLAVDEPATAGELALLMERARNYLKMIQWDSGTRMASTLSRIQNLLVRAAVTRREINMLHGMARNAMQKMAGGKP